MFASISHSYSILEFKICNANFNIAQSYARLMFTRTFTCPFDRQVLRVILEDHESVMSDSKSICESAVSRILPQAYGKAINTHALSKKNKGISIFQSSVHLPVNNLVLTNIWKIIFSSHYSSTDRSNTHILASRFLLCGSSMKGPLVPTFFQDAICDYVNLSVMCAWDSIDCQMTAQFDALWLLSKKNWPSWNSERNGIVH